MKKIFAAAFAFIFVTSAANAHEPPKILTQFGAKEQATHSQGIAIKMVKGVHLITGAPTPEPQKLAGSKRLIRKEIEISAFNEEALLAPFRLRSQGFYSGQRQSAWRYSQGFWSGY